jgi:hypothetical protein
MRKQPNGTPGKKPPAPSVKVKPGDFRTLVEILKGRKPRQADDAERPVQADAAASRRPRRHTPDKACARLI